ncbi:MAG: hypothetical protein ACJ75H_13845 [Thermoanaerobaculia bacterium]
MPKLAFVRLTGAALAAGGALVALLNLALTPRMVNGAPFEQTAVSTVYLWRQSLSLLAVGLLLFGCIGLYLSQAERGRRFGAVAFVAAFVGSTLIVAWEWVNIFVLRELALRAPDALAALEEAKGINLYDLGALIPVSLYTLGWLALAAWTWRVTPALRIPAALVVVGIFAIPLLSAAIGPGWGGALGNAILGCGFCLLGLAVRRGAHAVVG